MDELGFPERCKIFINCSLSHYFPNYGRKVRNCKILQRFNFGIAIGSIEIKIHNNSHPLVVTHENNFKAHFPDNDLSPVSAFT